MIDEFKPRFNIANEILLDICQNGGSVAQVEAALESGADINSVQMKHDERDNTFAYYTALNFAIERNYKEIVNVLMQRGADPNYAHPTEIAPALFVAFNCHNALELMQILIDNGSCIDTCYENMHILCSVIDGATRVMHMRNMLNSFSLSDLYEDVKILKLLLENNADVNFKSYHGFTPLHLACNDGHVEIIKILLDYNADVNYKNDSGHSPLYYAALGNSKDIIEMLISHGGDVNSRSNSGLTPLSIASANCSIEAVKILLQKTADANSRDNQGLTPLHHAARTSFYESINSILDVDLGDDYDYRKDIKILFETYLNTLKILIENKADVNARDERGDTPLHCVVMNDHGDSLDQLASTYSDIIKVIIVDINTGISESIGYCTWNNQDVIVAERSDLPESKNDHLIPIVKQLIDSVLKAIEVLLEKKADVNAKNNYGNTVMHCAAFRDDSDAIDLLIKYGANINELNIDGLTPLNVAVSNNCMKCIPALLENNANVNVQDKSGNTPLHYAALN